MNEKYGVYFGGVIKREKAVGKIEKHIEKIDDGDFNLGLIKSIDILRGVEAENIEHKLQNAKETTWVTDGIPKWKVWLIVKIARLKAKARWCWMKKQEVIKLSIEQIAKEVCESCYGSDEPKGKCEKCGYNVAIRSLKTVQAMKERNITVETCEEYMKFEDECVKKGFSFKSLLEAREKQEAKKPIDKGTIHKSLRCPICNCEVEFNSGIIQLGYCENCGQKIDWSNEE